MNIVWKSGFAALAAVSLGAMPAAAQNQKVTFTLNWVAGGDHAPYYYAQKMGLYKKAGIDLEIETGRGSAASAQKVGAGSSQLGLSDMAGVLLFRGKGADLVGVMNVYANSPQGLYWLKSSGIKSVKDLAGKKIGNPAGDGARTMWPAKCDARGQRLGGRTWGAKGPPRQFGAWADPSLSGLRSAPKAVDSTCGWTVTVATNCSIASGALALTNLP